MFRFEDNLIDAIRKEIDDLHLWQILTKSYPAFENKNNEWHLVAQDNAVFRDEMLMLAREVLDGF